MTRNVSVAPVLSALLLSLLVTACSPRMSTRTASRSTLAAAELNRYGNLLDAVTALRPEWLRERTTVYLSANPAEATTPASPVWVYWDGTRLGPPSYLARISPNQVESVRYFDYRTASMRWGINHENGVIYVTPAVGSVGPGID